MSDVRKLIIIGSGPAGFTAGIYSGRAELKPLLFAGEKQGGQLMNTALVENWPGAERGIMGVDLMMQMRKQAERFGTEIIDKKVGKVDFSKRPFKVWVGEEEYLAEAVIITTGAENKMLGVPGEKELLGKGVAVCAVCDAPLYKDKIVYVVGGGNAAVEDALALTKYAREVKMLIRRDVLKASKIMAEKVKNNPKIEILWNSELKEVMGENRVEKVRVINNKTNKEQELAADGVFLAIGHKPSTEIFKEQLELDEKGYIKTSENETMTSVEGVFAGGDVVDSKYKQAVTAAGMGCMAALDAEKWLEKDYV